MIEVRKELFEAYDYFKKKYNSDVILFHIGPNYYAIKSDVQFVAKADDCAAFYGDFENDDWYEWCGFSERDLKIMCYRLRHIASASVTIIDFRDEGGYFIVSKVKQIIKDMECDY